jgi:hypothetical protein
MSNIVRDRILYSGISEYIPSDISSFTQMSINEILNINEKLPDLDEIIKVSIHPQVRNTKLVKTGIGTSLEGQALTGYKYLSEGEFIIRIDFCGNDSNGCIYTFKDHIYFNNATTLPKNISENSRVSESIYIEDIYAQILSNRELLINISFIFTTENF